MKNTEFKTTTNYNVKTKAEAWKLADELFPTDYEQDSRATQGAGYPIYKSTMSTECSWISDLGCAIELTLVKGWYEDSETVNIWVVEDEDETSEAETTDNAETETEAESEAAETEREITEEELNEAVAEAVQAEIDAAETDTDEAEAEDHATLSVLKRKQIVEHINFERYTIGETLERIEAEYSRRADEAKARHCQIKMEEYLNIVQVVREMQEEEKARLLSDSAIDEALSIVDEALYQIDDKIHPVLRDALGIDAARAALYAAFEKAAQIVKQDSPIYSKYNLKDA